MKFTISQEAFAEGLQNAVSAVNSRSTLPILTNVLIQASDGELILTATDLDFTVRTKAEAKVGKSGSTTLPARRLSTLVKDLPKTEIEVEGVGLQREHEAVALLRQCVLGAGRQLDGHPGRRRR